MHHSYHTPGKTNLDQMRADAVTRTLPRNRFGNVPEKTVIHMHAKVDACVHQDHEIYYPTEDGHAMGKFVPTQDNEGNQQ